MLRFGKGLCGRQHKQLGKWSRFAEVRYSFIGAQQDRAASKKIVRSKNCLLSLNKFLMGLMRLRVEFFNRNILLLSVSFFFKISAANPTLSRFSMQRFFHNMYLHCISRSAFLYYKKCQFSASRRRLRKSVCASV